MRRGVCAFIFLAVAPLLRAQVPQVALGQVPKAPSCEQFSLIYHQKYFLNNARSALEVALQGGGTFLSSTKAFKTSAMARRLTS